MRVHGQLTLAAAAKSLNNAEDGTMKARASLELADAFLHFEPSGAQDAFHNAVESINKLQPQRTMREKQFYLSLLPLAEDVIRPFEHWHGKTGGPHRHSLSRSDWRN